MGRISIRKEMAHLTEVLDMYERGEISMLGDSHLDVMEACMDFVSETSTVESMVPTRVKARRLSDKVKAVRHLTLASTNLSEWEMEEWENHVDKQKDYFFEMRAELEAKRRDGNRIIGEYDYNQLSERVNSRIY